MKKFGLFLIILFLGAVLAICSWQYLQIDKLDQKNRSLTSEQARLKEENKDKIASVNDASAEQKIPVYRSTKSVEVTLYSPARDSKVATPLGIVGKVPGDWSFEASFPVKLKNNQGKVVAEAPAQLLGDPNTNNPVAFSAKLTWTSKETGVGSLVLEKDNPSGLAKNDDSVSIPIKF